MRNLKEKFLIYKIKKLRDPEVFGKFYDDYVDQIYRFIYFKVPSRQDAEDITSSVFLKFWQSIQEEENIENIRAYIYRIARNLVVDFYRQKNRQFETSMDKDYQDLKDDIKELQRIDNQADFEAILSTVNNLKDNYKEVILLRYIEELSIKEISKIINKSKGATRVIIHRALKTVKDLLDKDNNILSDESRSTKK